MSDAPSLRVAVVGASAGLGRCIGIGLAKKGARVAFLARRRDRLENAAKEAGSGAVAVACDVTDADAWRERVARIRRDEAGGSNNPVRHTEGPPSCTVPLPERQAI